MHQCETWLEGVADGLLPQEVLYVRSCMGSGLRFPWLVPGLAWPDAVGFPVSWVSVHGCFVVKSAVLRRRGTQLRALLVAAGMYDE